MSTTSVPGDSTPGTPIQPLHNPSQAAQVVVPQAPIGGVQNAAPGLGAKALLAKKLAKGRNPNDTVSPTDHMMTPCTRKLTEAKKKQFDKGPKPVQLFAQKDQVNPNKSGEANPKALNENEEKVLIDDDNPF